MMVIAILVGLMMCALPVETYADDAEVAADAVVLTETDSAEIPLVEPELVESPVVEPSVPPEPPVPPAPPAQDAAPTTVNEYWMSILVTIVSGVVVWALGMFSRWLSSRTSDQGLRSIIFQANDAAQTAVNATQQTYVGSIKASSEDGKLTDEEKSRALADALDTAKAQLGTKGLDTLKSAIGIGEAAADKWLETKIEAKVGEAKAAAATPPIPVSIVPPAVSIPPATPEEVTP
jgi:hypothetical protein